MKAITQPPARALSFGAVLLALSALPAFAQQSPERNAYFGELHIHSSWSVDAYVFGTRIGPEDATKYALGQPVVHPGGFKVQLKQPLDFTVVMDHSEYTGAFAMADDPNSPLRQNSPLVADLLRFGTWANGMDLYKLLSVTIVKDAPIAVLQGPEVAGYAWKQIVKIADNYYQPGKFTTFPGWEWTSTPDYKNLHRIVFFKDAKHVSDSEFSSVNSTNPEDLWKWLDGQRAAGNEVVAIPHNGNLSNGVLYPREVTFLGQPIDKAYAEARTRNEPVSEVYQVKGQSETTPRLSPEDEFADFGIFVWLLLGAKGVPTDYGSYMRLALRDGVAMQGAYGFNPYKFGMVAASDSHSAASAYRQDDYFGEHGTFDDTPEKRLSPVKHLNMDNRQVNPAGLTGVWAEENTREAIWAAIWRKETYATSGLHMKVRLFGGWEYDPAVLEQKDWAKAGYAKGVPMGGDLPEKKSQAPSFIGWAERDPSSANLDRIQIVKGWAKNGQSFEKIYDVAWSGDRKPDPATGKVPPINTTDLNNSNPLDTCPPAIWAKVDPETLKKQFDVLGVFKNGPRGWTMDWIELPAGPVLTFDGLEARWMGHVQLPKGVDLSRKGSSAYKPTQVHRKSVMTFEKGKPVFILEDPGGTPWVMQAYSQIVDPNLTYDGLEKLGDKLKPAPGWKFRTKVLDQDLTIRAVNGTARIVQDDLENTYDACFETACSYKP